MDFQQLAQQLLAAIQQSSDQQLNLAGVNRDNNFATINNQSNKAGTLYSTKTSFQQGKANTDYLGAVNKIGMNNLTQRFSVGQILEDNQRKIDAANKAAAEMNSLNFDQFGVIA